MNKSRLSLSLFLAVLMWAPMATSLRAVSTNIVISEFRTRGPAGGNDEFIEIHNISNAAVSIGGWKIRGSNSSGTVGDRVVISAGATLGPGCFYLVTNSGSSGYSGTVAGNQTYTSGVTDDGGIAITLADNTVIDAVGMSAGSAYKEGTTLTPTTTNAERGIERKPGGASGHKTDTDNNASDFQANAASNPQNAQSACIQYVDQAPSVSSTSPAAGAANVLVSSAVTVNFSESVTTGAAAFTLTCNSTSQPFTQSPSPGTASASFTLTPNANLPYSSNCVVGVVAAQVTDQDANDPPDNMAANFSFSFDTQPAADVAPSVVSTTPANGALDVALASNVVINFSEPVTATVAAFAIDCGSGPVAFGQTSGASVSFTLDPNVNLPAGRVCNVSMTASAVSDLDGNDPPDHPASDYAFSFTTTIPVATNVLINEIDADTPGSPQDLAEFVELYDGGAGNTSLHGLTVVFYDGGTHASYASFDLDGYTTNAQGYFTLGNPGVNGVDLEFGPGPFGTLQNGADAVALVIGNASSFPTGTPIGTANVLDAIAYDTDDADDAQLRSLLNAGQPQINENGNGNGPNQSIGRCGDGSGGARNTFTYRNTVPSPDGPNTCPPPVESPIVISQFYGGGGNTGATYQNDYVELYNKSTATVDITGWSLQYASSGGSGWDFNKTPLGGPIAPGEYYLVKLASNGAVGDLLPAPNVTGLINMSGSSGKIALVGTGDSLAGDCPLGNPNLRDLVGYGTASCGEGLTTAPTLSNSTAEFRRNGGATDTDRNVDDFTAGTPAPRRTAPITELRPFLLSADPSTNATNVPKDPTIALQFSEPVTTTGNDWFDLTCAQSGAHNSYTRAGSGTFIDLTINDPLTPGESCTITILQNGVHDADTDDATPATDVLPWNYQWSFTVSISQTPPPFGPEVHLAFGNPTNATADTNQYDNYLMSKPEYALSYNRDLGRPNWVSWHLSSEWFGTLARVDTFRADPQIPAEEPWYRVQGFDFANSGFDRGHMVPNADRDKETAIPNNQATYLMTNMIAQAPNNNQGPWAAMEAELRTIAGTANELYIVAGPAGVGGTGSNASNGNNGFASTIAGGHVTVPAFTWKVALVLPKGDNDLSRVTCSTRSIAVIMPNEQIIAADWKTYLTTIDGVEALTGYDFFSSLPANLQYCVEAFVDGVEHVADVTAPVIQCDSPDGAWHADNTTLSCTATDGESGLANGADAAFTLSTLVPGGVETANASTDSRVVCDAVGNCATAGPIAGNQIDRKNPAATITAPVDGAVYMLNDTVTGSFSCVDGGSGVSACIGTSPNGSPIDTASSGPKTFVATAIDAVGNASTATVSYTVATGPLFKRTPSISITNIPGTAVKGGGFTPTYSYDGDGIIHLQSETPTVCKVKADSTVTFVGAGTCTLVATATPTGSVNAARGPAQSFIVLP